MKRAEHALRLAMDDALRALKLTTPQYAALSAVEENPGSSGAALARQCFVTPQTMNEIVGLLVAAGLIRRAPHPENRRIVRLYLTEEGEQVLAQAHRAIEAIEARMVEHLSDADQAQLGAWLRACAQALEAR